MYAIKATLLALVATAAAQNYTILITPYAPGDTCSGKHYKPFTVTTAGNDQGIPGPCVKTTTPININSTSFHERPARGSHTIPVSGKPGDGENNCYIRNFEDSACRLRFDDFYVNNKPACSKNPGAGSDGTIGFKSFNLNCFIAGSSAD